MLSCTYTYFVFFLFRRRNMEKHVLQSFSSDLCPLIERPTLATNASGGDEHATFHFCRHFSSVVAPDCSQYLVVRVARQLLCLSCCNRNMVGVKTLWNLVLCTGWWLLAMTLCQCQPPLFPPNFVHIRVGNPIAGSKPLPASFHCPFVMNFVIVYILQNACL